MGHFFIAIANMWDPETNGIVISDINDIRECLGAGILSEKNTGSLSSTFGKVEALFDGCVSVDEMLTRIKRVKKNKKLLSDEERQNMSEEYCGNVDIPQFKEGATVVLRCNVDGGLLSIGDVHAAQGDGEITDCAFECQGRTTVRVSIIKKDEMLYYGCPQVNNEKMIGSVGVFEKNHTMAIKRGYTDLIRRMEAEYGIGASDAYMLLCLCGKVQIGNGCTAVCMIDRDILKKYKR